MVVLYYYIVCAKGKLKLIPRIEQPKECLWAVSSTTKYLLSTYCTHSILLALK